MTQECHTRTYPMMGPQSKKAKLQHRGILEISNDTMPRGEQSAHGRRDGGLVSVPIARKQCSRTCSQCAIAQRRGTLQRYITHFYDLSPWSAEPWVSRDGPGRESDSRVGGARGNSEHEASVCLEFLNPRAHHAPTQIRSSCACQRSSVL